MSRSPKGTTANQRFWQKVDTSAGPNGCWLWMGGIVNGGYGQFFSPNEDGSVRQVRAHRHSFEMANGPIPEGALVRHGCDNPRCVNPRHLTLGTHWDNNHDAAAKGRSYIKWLDEDTVAQIKTLLALGQRQSDIARKFKITRYAVWGIAHGKRHASGGDPHAYTGKRKCGSTRLETR